MEITEDESQEIFWELTSTCCNESESSTLLYTSTDQNICDLCSTMINASVLELEKRLALFSYVEIIGVDCLRLIAENCQLGTLRKDDCCTFPNTLESISTIKAALELACIDPLEHSVEKLEGT